MEMEQLSLFDDRTTTAPWPAVCARKPWTSSWPEPTLGEGKILHQIIDQDNIPSMIFWVLPGWKTTLASIIAKRTHAEFINFSAVTSGIKEIKEVMAQAEQGAAWASGRGIRGRDPPLQQSPADAFSPMLRREALSSSAPPTENPSLRSTPLCSPLPRLCAPGPWGGGSDQASEKRPPKSQGLRLPERRYLRRHAGAIARFSGGVRTALNIWRWRCPTARSARKDHRDAGDSGAVHEPANPCSTTRTARSTTI